MNNSPADYNLPYICMILERVQIGIALAILRKSERAYPSFIITGAAIIFHLARICIIWF